MFVTEKVGRSQLLFLGGQGESRTLMRLPSVVFETTLYTIPAPGHFTIKQSREIIPSLIC